MVRIMSEDEILILIIYNLGIGLLVGFGYLKVFLKVIVFRNILRWNGDKLIEGERDLFIIRR